MKKNKIFSFRLMLEGIRQTKTVGAILFILSFLLSCGNPLIELAAAPTGEVQTLEFYSFALPVFVSQYIIPVVITFMLFSFTNSRRSSDFYHSIPLSRTCVYLSFSAAALLWSAVSVLFNSITEYILYCFVPIVSVTADFILPTVLSSLALAVLIISVILAAKGLSGTMFSNIIISCMIAFVPRTLIYFFTTAVNSAAVVADVSFMSFANIYNNILFAPGACITGGNTSDPLVSSATLLYSVILAAVYFALGLVLHNLRASEAAEKSSAFRFVQPIVRILLGTVPLLVISVNVITGSEITVAYACVCVIISLLAYFLYEFITTKNGKKLLTSAPLYLIAIAFSVAFAAIGIWTSDSLLNDIPSVSEISSVSFEVNDYTYPFFKEDNYYVNKTKDIEFDDKELIEILQSSLSDTVKRIKEEKAGNETYRSESAAEKTVIFHCTSGKDLKRTFFVYSDNSEEDPSSRLTPYLEKNKEYSDAVNSLPADNEIKSMGLDWLGDEDGVDFSDEELNRLWQSYKDEYNALSRDEKARLSGSDVSSDKNIIYMLVSIKLTGYTGLTGFTQHYFVSAADTPKTFKIFSDLYTSKLISGGVVDTIKETAATDNNFELYFGNMMNSDDSFDMSYIDLSEKYDNLEEQTDIYGSFSGRDYSGFTNTEENKKKLRELCEMLTNAISDDIDITKENLIHCTINYDGNYEYDSAGNAVSFYGYSRYYDFYIALSDEQYKEVESVIKTCSAETVLESVGINVTE